MDDLISRRAAIDMLSKQLDYLDTLDKYDNPTAVSQWYGINWARNNVAKLPSAQPERKKGRWIGKPIAGYCTVRCSVCNVAFRENSGRWNFCPVCGAYNQGETNDAEIH